MLNGGLPIEEAVENLRWRPLPQSSSLVSWGTHVVVITGNTAVQTLLSGLTSSHCVHAAAAGVEIKAV